MFLLNLLKRNKILAFTVGIFIFGLLNSGIFFLNNNFSQRNNQTDNQVILAVGNNPPNSTSPLGINLSGIADWSTELPFLDHFKLARGWMTQCTAGDPGCQGQFSTDEQNLLNLDENGWVKSLPAPDEAPTFTRVGTLLLREIENMYPTGRYIVMYEGEGTIEYGFEATKIEAESKPGRDVIDVKNGGGGIWLQITSTDPKKTGNYIRNIRVVKESSLPLYEKGEIFNPVFLDKLKAFRVIRFMDWMGTNGSQQKDWAARPKVTDHSWAATGKGVPVEIMVALANKLKADPWFNIPHRATDDYIAKFSQYVKDNLDPNLKIHVEYSNEVWNWSFPQATYAKDQAKAKWNSDQWMEWYGMRAAQTCEIWKQQIFGNQKNRVSCVAGTQMPWKGMEDAILECPLWVKEGNEPCWKHGFDEYAITGYFSGELGNPETANTVLSWLNEPDGGFSKAFQQIRDGSVLNKSFDSLKSAKELYQYHANKAKAKGLKLVAYEGGQSIVGGGHLLDNQKFNDFVVALNRRPEMHDIYIEALNDWKQSGGTLFNQYHDVGRVSKWGNWGALEYIDQNGSPKYNALIKFIDNNPCWWDGCVRNFTQNKPS